MPLSFALVFLVVYLFLIGRYWSIMLDRVYGLSRQAWSTKLLGYFVVLILLSFTASIFIVFYRLTPIMIWVTYVLVMVTTGLLYFLTRKIESPSPLSPVACRLSDNPKEFFGKHSLIVALYLLLWLIALFLLYQSQSAAVLQSPWQTINQYYLPIFFVLTFLLGVMIWSRSRTKTILFFIVLHSLLLHVYLPLSHELPWGGDVWRHIAIEKKIAAGEFIKPVLFGTEREVVGIADLQVPLVLVEPQKYAYGQMWGLTVLLSQTLQIDLLQLNKWLVPIVWSIVAPLLFFHLGQLLFSSRRLGLLFAWLSFIPFSLQALGSLTLPVSLGYLTFFFVLLLLLCYLRDGQGWQLGLVFVFSLLMLFGYPLHALVIWSLIILSLIIQKVYKPCRLLPIAGSQVGKLASWQFLLAIAVSIFIIPLAELETYSSVFDHWQGWGQIKPLLGQFSGWYFASAIRPHDILSGNIFFNQTPISAFVASPFISWRWYVIPLMIIIFCLFFYGFCLLFTRVVKPEWRLMGLLAAMSLGGYIIGWYVLQGDRLLTRRLDAMVAFGLTALAMYGGKILGEKYSFNFWRLTPPYLLFVFLFILSWFTATTYASGPDLRVVSKDEYQAAKYVWSQSDRGLNNYCVLADTWMLLALEAESAGQIVGGGFPIGYQFAQPERVVLLNEMINNPRASVLTLSHEKTGADNCWVVLPTKALWEEKRQKLVELTGDAGVEIGELAIWREES